MRQGFMIEIHCKYDKLLSIKEIKPDPENRNKHDKEQIENLAEIIEYQGWRHPLIINQETGLLRAGHGRLLAAKKLKLKEVPVVYQNFKDSDQDYAFMVSDNAIARQAELDLSGINADIGKLGPDFEIKPLGIKDFKIDIFDEPEGDPDEVPEVKEESKVVQGEVYILGNHRLMCGDSTNIQNVEYLISKNKIDLVYTDPPYGINEKGDRSSRGGITTGNILQDFKDDTIQYAIDAFNHCQALEIPLQIWWGANYYCHSLPQSNSWIVWDKRIEEKQTDMNSDCELAWYQESKKSVRIFRHFWKGLIKGSEHNQKRVHPTQKPTALAEWCFDFIGENKSVLDLFGGSGSTLIACEKTDRKCFMMEFEPHYVQVILDRWQKYTGKKAIREDGKLWDDIKEGK